MKALLTTLLLTLGLTVNSQSQRPWEQLLAEALTAEDMESGARNQWDRYLINADFQDRTDKAIFSYSLDGKVWNAIGDTLQMYYDWPDFCGYRFALFHFATKEVGGIADFDYFRVTE